MKHIIDIINEAIVKKKRTTKYYGFPYTDEQIDNLYYSPISVNSVKIRAYSPDTVNNINNSAHKLSAWDCVKFMYNLINEAGTVNFKNAILFYSKKHGELAFLLREDDVFGTKPYIAYIDNDWQYGIGKASDPNKISYTSDYHNFIKKIQK